MPVDSYKLGPGVLTLGSGPLAVHQQLTAFRIVPSESVSTIDARKVLSGEELAAESTTTITYTVTGTFIQSLLAAGVIAWSWTNAGEDEPFTFQPTGASGASFTGTVTVVPLEVGGDVDVRNESSFTWRGVGELPTPTWD